MRSNKQSLQALIVAAILSALAAFPATASVGKAIYTFGNVTVEKPAIGLLKRGGTVDEGDVIVTGPKGYAQIKLDDGTKIAIRPDSRFVIEAVEAPATPTTPAIGAGKTLRAKFNLQRGGFRTITGRISKRDPAAYQVTTPTAVISVRGTNYVARLCAANCGARVKDGLYVGVSRGGVGLTNNGGSVSLSNDQFGFAGDYNQSPTKLTAPPPSLTDDGLAVLDGAGSDDDDGGDEESTSGSGGSDDSDGSGGSSDEGSGDGSGGTGGDTGDGTAKTLAADRSTKVGAGTKTTTTTTTTDTRSNLKEPKQEITGAGTGGQPVDLTGGEDAFVPLGAAYTLSTTAAGINTNADTLSVDANGNLAGFDAITADGGTTSFAIGAATNNNTGFDPDSQLRWGRWAEGIATQSSGAAPTNLDLNNQNLHWVLASSDDVVPVQQITGSSVYTLVGNTDPTDNLGNVGILGSASFFADFTNATVESGVQLGINQTNWQASGSGTITANLFQGLYDTVFVNGNVGGSGSFGGTFGGYGATGLPAGAGLTYQLTNGSTTINGVAIFKKSTAVDAQ